MCVYACVCTYVCVCVCVRVARLCILASRFWQRWATIRRGRFGRYLRARLLWPAKDTRTLCRTAPSIHRKCSHTLCTLSLTLRFSQKTQNTSVLVSYLHYAKFDLELTVRTCSGTKLATVSGDTTVKIWDLSKTACVHTFTDHPQTGEWRKMCGIVFCQYCICWLVMIEMQRRVCCRAVWSCSWHSCGNFLATASQDSTCKVWDLNRCEPQATDLLALTRPHRHTYKSKLF